MRLAIWGLGVALGVAALSASAPASAFTQETNEVFADGYGNKNVFGGFSVSSSQANDSGTVGVTLPDGFVIRPFLSSGASQSLDTSVKFFKASAKPIVASVYAEGYWEGDGAIGVYTPKARAKIVVLGKTLYSSSGTDCAANKRCVTADKTYEKEFARGGFVWVVFAIPVEITGAITGSVGAGLDASATALRYLGINNSLFSRVNAGWGAHAGLTVAFDACIGICKTLGVSLQARFNVLTLDVGPKATSVQGSVLTGNAKYSGTNKAAVTLTTMNGDLKARADYLLGHEETRIVKWDGFSDSWDLWSDTPSFTCDDYNSRPSSDCRD
jgi:hypothetical protein